MVSEYLTLSKKNWQIWKERSFRIKLVSWFVVAILTLTSLTIFFRYIEGRTGLHLNDPVLNALPAKDVSIPIFLLIWTNALLILLTFIKNPGVLLLFLIGYTILTIARMVTITLLPLEPPPGLIALKDPLSNLFYGARFVTKDLFFSGHTSTLLLIFYNLKNRKLKLFSIAATCLVGFLLLLQHVHYTIDIIFAFPFVYVTCLLAKKIA